MNRCIFFGRVTADVDLKPVNSKTPIAEFCIAVNIYSMKEHKQTATFLDMVAYGKVAENLAKTMTKGRQALFDCYAFNDTYTNKQGKKVSKVRFRVNSFEIGDGKYKNRTEDIVPSMEDVPLPDLENEDFMSIPEDIDQEEFPF